MMAMGTLSRQSRRQVLGGVVGALAAIGAQALGRPQAVHAGGGDEGDVMHVGGDHLGATSATQLKNSTTDNDIFIATSTKAGRGVYGKSESDIGVEGRSVRGLFGVRGVVESSGSWAVQGQNEGSGMIGALGTGSAGVHGSGPVGVAGSSSGGIALKGFAIEGTGLEAHSNRGVGVLARTITGTALRVSGPARFSRSGVATIATGDDRVTVQIAALAADSFVLATLQQYRSGVFVVSATPKPDQDAVVVRLNKPVAEATRVAYQVLDLP